MKIINRDFLTLTDLSPSIIDHLVSRTMEFGQIKQSFPQVLKGKSVGIYFPKASTRTRTSFTMGAMKLGAQVIAYGPNDLQLTTGETIEDTAMVLSAYLDILVIRNNGSDEELRRFAARDNLSVINAMSESEHPSQLIADLATIKEKFGQLNNVHLLYTGAGNNTAAALALGVAQVEGMKITFLTPEGNELPVQVRKMAQVLSERYGGQVNHSCDINNLPGDADVVYTTRWQTMGEPKQDPGWREKFVPFRVTMEFMEKAARRDAIFLHDLPAEREEDTTSEVMDNYENWIFKQARNKMYSAMAIMEWCTAL